LIGCPADWPRVVKRDVEQAGGLLGIVEEQLVEIAHPVEQQDVRMLGLDAQVLLHHWGVSTGVWSSAISAIMVRGCDDSPRH
jgi:hypothetical protein